MPLVHFGNAHWCGAYNEPYSLSSTATTCPKCIEIVTAATQPDTVHDQPTAEKGPRCGLVRVHIVTADPATVTCPRCLILAKQEADDESLTAMMGKFLFYAVLGVMALGFVALFVAVVLAVLGWLYR